MLFLGVLMLLPKPPDNPRERSNLCWIPQQQQKPEAARLYAAASLQQGNLRRSWELFRYIIIIIVSCCCCCCVPEDCALETDRETASAASRTEARDPSGISSELLKAQTASLRATLQAPELLRPLKQRRCSKGPRERRQHAACVCINLLPWP